LNRWDGLANSFLKLLNFLLSALDPTDLQALLPHLEEVSLSATQVLFETGDVVDAIYFPGSACISITTIMEDGKAVETSTVGRESGVGLLDALTQQPVRTRIFCQIAGSATRLPTGVFRRRVAESPALLNLILRHVRATAIQSEQGVACNISHEVQGRLARWLLMTQDRVGAAKFPLTQEYMAVMTGVQRSTVSVMAGALKKAGVIDYVRGQVVVRDREALIRHACECYTVVSEEFQALQAGANKVAD
jgi:CRP-like cAMP-binding protein